VEDGWICGLNIYGIFFVKAAYMLISNFEAV